MINFDYTKESRKRKSIQRRRRKVYKEETGKEKLLKKKVNYKEIKEDKGGANKNKTNVQKYFHNDLTKECR